VRTAAAAVPQAVADRPRIWGGPTDDVLMFSLAHKYCFSWEGAVVAPHDGRAVRPVRDKTALLRSHALFRDLPPKIIEHLGSYVTKRTLEHGASIFNKGDAGSGLFCILAGSVKISIPSNDGRGIVLSIAREGEFFGDMALLDGRPRSADAEAMSECELAVIERRDFLPFLRGQPEVMLKLIELLCLRLRRTNEQVQNVALMNSPIRLAKTLLRLAAETKDCKIKITQSELGDMIGRTREITNKCLREWEKKELVLLKRGSVTVVKPEKLAEIAEQDMEFDDS